MNDKKLELAKKKALLEELRQRKLERQKQKENDTALRLSSNGNSTVRGANGGGAEYHNGHSSSATGLSSSSSNHQFFYSNNYANSVGHEFNNLNADEILMKIGLGDGLAAAASTPYSTSTLTPSSSYSMSLSSSTQSIHSSTLAANKRTTSTTTTTTLGSTRENSNIRYEEVVNYGPNTTSTTTSTTTGFNGYVPSSTSSSLLPHSKSTATVSAKPASTGQTFSSSSDNSNEFIFACKKIDKFKLTSSVNMNVVNISPNESIKYAKETQTTELPSKPSHPLNDDEDGHVSDRNENIFQEELKRKKKQQKPLAFYEDIFVYDTLQWEDEFNPFDGANSESAGRHGGKQQHGGSHDYESGDDNKSLTENLDHLHIMSPNSAAHQRRRYQHSSDSVDHRNSSSTIESEEDDMIDAASDSLKAKPSNGSNQKSGQNIERVDIRGFAKFMTVKRPIVERALRQNEGGNIFFDYSASTKIEKVDKDAINLTVKLKKTLNNPDKQTPHSVVSCLDWSSQYPELLVCSYDNMVNGEANYEDVAAEAVVCLWNVKSESKTAQQTFICSGLITSCNFSSFHPNLIIAGTYSGQILMWDVRSNKRTPIQRSSLSMNSHMNPVYCTKVIGTNDCQNLISLSNDGRLCVWSLENLNMPLETQDLLIKGTASKAIYATCFDFQSLPINLPKSNTNDTITGDTDTTQASSRSQLNNYTRSIVVGAEDGLIHSLSITGNGVGNKISTGELFDEHMGPVTSVSCFGSHACSSEDRESDPSLSQLFLSASFDSTIKLWSMADNSMPVHSFETGGDYIFDVGWSPVHPAVFASVDGVGRLDLWNLNRNIETPSVSYHVDSASKSHAGSRTALNKLKWSRKGTEIAVGDDQGRISLFEVGDSFVYSSDDDLDQLASVVNSMRQMTSETNEFSQSKKSDNIKSLIESLR